MAVFTATFTVADNETFRLDGFHGTPEVAGQALGATTIVGNGLRISGRVITVATGELVFGEYI